MNIYDFAMKMELDGREYYLKLAGNAPKTGLKNIFLMLADDEKLHYDVIKKAKEEQKDLEFSRTKVLSNAKNIFEDLKDKQEELEFSGEYLKAYRKAQDLEQQSIDYYRTRAGEVDEEDQKALFYKLAREEEKHFFLLENMIEFISRPLTWLENAEFTKLEEY